jgi:hypothetical protein
METTNGKLKPRRFSLIRLQFAYNLNGSLSVLPLLTEEKNPEVILLQTDFPNYG